MADNPLGHPTDYVSEYAPELLYGIAREDGRSAAPIPQPLPFHGVDFWTAWELGWLTPRGKPQIATAEFRVPADSPNIIESKSLKLYLNSLAMMRYDSRTTVRDLIARDLSRTAGSEVAVSLTDPGSWKANKVGTLPGTCVDDADIECDTWDVDPALLQTGTEDLVLDELYSQVLRSNCPVTDQPDTGSVLIRYSGKRIVAGSLLRYIASYRQHNGFHEACVERMFVDIQQRCAPERLTVYARYNRRGGLDINPFRSNFEHAPEDLRLWTQ